MSRTRDGVTLIELIVVLAVLGILAGLTTVGFRAERPVERSLAARIAAARRDAVQTGRPVSFVLDDSGSPHAIRALPDGRVLADVDLGVDMTTGRIGDATR